MSFFFIVVSIFSVLGMQLFGGVSFSQTLPSPCICLAWLVTSDVHCSGVILLLSCRPLPLRQRPAARQLRQLLGGLPLHVPGGQPAELAVCHVRLHARRREGAALDCCITKSEVLHRKGQCLIQPSNRLLMEPWSNDDSQAAALFPHVCLEKPSTCLVQDTSLHRLTFPVHMAQSAPMVALF